MDSSRTNVIEIKNLTTDYGGGKGIFDISFVIKKGEVFGFLGPNGAGKTTTIRHLMGFLKNNVGSCLIDGLDCWEQRYTIQKNLGYIAGEISLFDEMNANQFFDFIIKYRKTKTAPRLNELIKLFELNSHVKIKKMSKGMKQKVAIITAFMHDPEILILDEPTSGLDPLMQAKFIDLIMAEKKRKKTIIISSHMFDEVEKTCDRICIIKSGKIVALDTAANLHKKYVKPYIVTLANTQLAKSFAKDFNGILHGTKVTVSTKQTLEEIFLNFYKKENNEPDSI